MQLPPITTKELVLEKLNRFSEFQLWPLKSSINPEGWLGNFTSEEAYHAIHLLNAFLYFAEHITDQIFYSAFQRLSQEIFNPADTAANNVSAWRRFLAGSVVTYVTGEHPNPTDSGFLFARKARQRLGIPEERILDPASALRCAAQGRCENVIFVDDFVGSGEQCIKTWERQYPLSPQASASFSSLIPGGARVRFFYCPAIATKYGADRIKAQCPDVKLMPGNIIGPRYSAFGDNSLVWPASIKPSATAFLERASLRAGIPTDGTKDDWRGFHRLGLTLGFSHSVPDATLPIFYWQSNGWVPLLVRS